jgi:hypothetical protein
MKKVFSAALLGVLLASNYSCQKTDETEVEPIRDYYAQTAFDMQNIEAYLKSHYIEVVNNPGFSDDMDVTITKIPTGGSQVSIWDQTEYPLQTYELNTGYVDYDVYYLKLREGSGPNSVAPTNVDSILAAYKGSLLNGTVFDFNPFPQSYFSLTNTVSGWSRIFPKFKTGSYTENGDGTITYNDFGAGVMFLPSAFGYYNQTLSSIPAYSPLVFSFKLYAVKRADQDNDGVLSYLEDINGDGYLNSLDDTDGDGTADYLDIDDDGDGVITKNEIKNPLTNLPYAYVDIPTCGAGGNGKKKYLDASCQ